MLKYCFYTRSFYDNNKKMYDTYKNYKKKRPFHNMRTFEHCSTKLLLSEKHLKKDTYIYYPNKYRDSVD